MMDLVQLAERHVPEQVRTARPGEALVLPTDRLWVLVRGEVVVSRASRPIEVWSAPRPLDLAGSVRGQRNARFVAATEVRVLGVPRESVDPTSLADALAREAEQLWSRVEADARRDDDTFLPWAEPVPGPWRFRRVLGTILVIEGDRDRLQRSLPRGARLLPTGGRFLVAITKIEGAGSEDPRDARTFDYCEVTPFVPVWTLPHGPSAWVPELYPDSWMATILGREIHGFPKRVARVSVREEGADLLIDRRLALRVRHRSAGRCSAAELAGEMTRALYGVARFGSWVERAARAFDADARGFTLPVLVRKRIGAPETAGATRSIDALVRVPFRFDPLAGAERLEITSASIGEGPGVLHGTVIAAFRVTSSFRFGAGEVVRGLR